MMNQFLVLILGLLSAAMAGVIYSRGGETFCNGMSCPANTGCSIVSNYVNEVRITKSSCFNLTGHIVKEQITEVEDGSVFFSDGTLTCTISSSMVNGEMNTSKTCRDKNGNEKPMTPDQEAFFMKMLQDVEKGWSVEEETHFEEEMEGMMDEFKDFMDDFMDDFKDDFMDDRQLM